VFNGGGALGYNFKSEEGLVFGLEADFGTMRLNKDVSTTVTYPCCAPSTFTIRQVLYTDYLITARARVGWAHGRAMYYVTGGLAATNVNPYRGVFSDTFGPAYENTSANGWLTGWTIGAGVEVKATRHWTVKGEYLYADFGDVTLVGTDFNILGVPVPGQVFIYNTDVRAHMLRGGVNYYF
jgi:outer membrane immunogenic protein